MLKSITILASSCLCTADALYNMHVSFNNDAFDKIKANWLSNYYQDHLYKQNVTLDKSFTGGKFTFMKPSFTFADGSPKNFEEKVMIEPLNGEQVRQFVKDKNLNVRVETDFTYQFFFLTAKGHLDLNLVNSEISFEAEVSEQNGEHSEEAAKVEISAPALSFDQDASTLNITGNGPIIWILKKFSSTLKHDLFTDLNEVGQKFLTGHVQDMINTMLLNHQFPKIFSNLDLDLSLTQKPLDKWDRALFSFNGSFVGETADGNRVRAEPIALSNSFASDEVALTYAHHEHDFTAALSEASVNSFLNVLQRNDIKIDFRDLLRFVGPYSDAKTSWEDVKKDELKVGQLCNFLPNICDLHYAIDPETVVRAYVSLPNATKPSTADFQEDMFTLNFTEMRFELHDVNTKELYEDFILEGVSWSQKMYTQDGWIKTEDKHSFIIDSVKFATKTAYMHNEEEIFKMSRLLPNIARSFNDQMNGSRYKIFQNVYLYTSMIKFCGKTKAMYFGAAIDPAYFGLPQ